jgi:hypothetical protein
MSRLSRPATATTIDERPRKPGVMIGAEGPDTPDRHRPLARVLEDHANRAWGAIRDVSPLNRAHAEKVLVKALGGLLESVRDDTNPLKDQVKALQLLGSKMMAMIVKLATRAPQYGDPANDNRRRCRHCGQPMTKHDEICKVNAVLKAGREAGMVVADE